MVNYDSGAEKAGEAGETDGCRGECVSNRDRGRSLYLDARCFARVENICWSACIDGLTSFQRKNTAEIIKGRAVPDLLCDSQLLNLHNQRWRGLCTVLFIVVVVVKETM